MTGLVRSFSRFSCSGLRRPNATICMGLLALSFVLSAAEPAGAQDIVLYSSDVTTIRGNWSRVASSSGAGSEKMTSADVGWAAVDAPLASPGNYFEATFNARAWIGYRVWLRMRAINNTKWNDAVWVQFSDSLVAGGSALYRIGTTSAMLFNLEECSGCGVSGWGWSGGAWWVSQPLAVEFPSDGAKTIRIQTREDGVEIDQIVLSQTTYMNAAPGRSRDDTTILPQSSGGGTASAPAPAPVGAKALPGTIEAEDFDTGANGTAYWDSSAGNSGGQHRATDVDIEGCSAGGYNVGWTSSGEWLNYTVNVGAAGTYKLDFRLASAYGGTLHVEFGGEDKTGAVTVPATGGWQSWTTISRNVTLSAGTQIMRVVFDTSNLNLNSIVATATTAVAPPPSAPARAPFGGVAWTLPGTVQLEDYDQGGQHVAYYDNSAGNAGGAYRAGDVDIETTPTGGYTVAWAFAGEWLAYTVNVTAAGNYRLVARVASAGAGGSFHVEFNGVDRTGAMTVPNTGGWTTYQDVAATVWLDAGVQTMRIALDSNGPTTAVGNLSYVRVEAPAAAPPPPPPPGGGRLRVATWNIHFGHGNVWGQAQEIVNTGADVILLQEASTFDEYMPSTYPDRLRQLTGQTWYSVWAPSATCGGGCQGTMILSRFPLADSSVAVNAGAPMGRALINVGGVYVNLFTTHLEYYNTDNRTAQLLELMNWSRGFGGPKIVGGDFNSWWGEWWIRQMENEYSDTWQDVTGGDGDGYTLNGNVRFDYLFRAYDQNWRLTPTACWVHWTNLSDHMPVVADYRVQ